MTKATAETTRTRPAGRKPGGSTWKPAQAGRPTGTGQDSRQADQGPEQVSLNDRWLSLLDCPPAPVHAGGEFDWRPTAVSRIMLLVADCKRWGDEIIGQWIEENWERWGVIHRHLSETEAFIADAVPDVPEKRIKAAAREITIGWIEFRMLERGTASEFRQRLAAAWRKLR
ncbi:MAG TPA: hypothetical protein PLY86_21220 [bacterium]|nr:hypothetical protein [bacterium]